MVAIMDGVGSRAREAFKYDAWAKIKVELRGISDQWEQTLHDKSVTFRHKKHGHLVKVTLDGEVYVDQKLSKNTYRSEVHKLSLTDAAIAVRGYLIEFA